MYRRPPVCDLKPPHAFGGHTFLHVGEHFLRCVGCYGIIAVHELHEGFMAARIGAWCSDALIALEAPAVKHVCEYCHGKINAAPRVMDRTIAIHLDSCPAAARHGHKPRNLLTTEQVAPRKRVIPRQKL